MVEESYFTLLLVVTVMKLDENPSEEETKHNVLDKAQPLSFQMKQQDIVQRSSSEIISGANFPKVMFIVF